jgi:hypothetical protein
MLETFLTAGFWTRFASHASISLGCAFALIGAAALLGLLCERKQPAPQEQEQEDEQRKAA